MGTEGRRSRSMHCQVEAARTLHEIHPYPVAGLLCYRRTAWQLLGTDPGRLDPANPDRLWSIQCIRIDRKRSRSSSTLNYCALQKLRLGERNGIAQALIRDALRAHLKNLAIRERGLRGRKGYEAGPSDSGDWSGGIVRGDIRLYGFVPPDKARPVEY